jgi:hypothetical protein
MTSRIVSKGVVGGAVIAAAVLVLAGCGNSSPKPAASAQAPGSKAAGPASKVTAVVFSPEKGSVQGVSGKGMVVDLAFKAAAADIPKASFRLGGALPDPAVAVKPGHNPAFPGLVVTLSTTAAANGGPQENLANLFQIVSVSTQADGNSEVWATWTNAKAGFGVDVDTQLNAYTVSGDAPDTVPAGQSGLTVTSNLVTVAFHLAGPVPAPTATTTSAP